MQSIFNLDSALSPRRQSTDPQPAYTSLLADADYSLAFSIQTALDDTDSRENRCRIASRAMESGFSTGDTYGHGSTKVLLIIGLAGTHDSWGPQIKGLAGTNAAGDDGGEGIEVCCFDNRGMGRRSVPANKSDYSTSIMAKDALALLDHLGWKKAHVFGHSMGSMIACKLAALAPNRLSSLASLNATGGGIECFPKVNLSLMELIEASESDLLPQEWSNVPQNESGWLALSTRSSLTRTYGGFNWLVLAYSILGKLVVYFFAVFLMLLEHAKKAPRFMRPVRVASSISQDEH